MVTPMPHPRPPVSAPRMTSGVLMLMAGILAISSTFPISLHQSFLREGKEQYGFDENLWTRTNARGSIQFYGHAPLFGIALSAAGALALVAGVVLLVSARRGGRSGIAIAAGSALAAVVCTLGLAAEATLNVNGHDLGELRNTSGVGLWLMLASGVLGLVGMVLALIPRRQPFTPFHYQFGVSADAPTPPQGFPQPGQG